MAKAEITVALDSTEMLKGLAEKLNTAYCERNQLVAFLSRVYPAYYYLDETQEPFWQTVICVESPQGQMTWHVNLDDKEAYFPHLTSGPANWDGHTTDEKYERLARCGEEYWIAVHEISPCSCASDLGIMWP